MNEHVLRPPYAVVGDSSDNIPGVEGIGAKTAPKLLSEYGNIEGAIANAAAVKNKRVRESLGSEKGAASAHLCRSLVKIRTRRGMSICTLTFAAAFNSPGLTFFSFFNETIFFLTGGGEYDNESDELKGLNTCGWC